MKRQLSGPAQRDIAQVLDWSHDTFGPAARDRYEALILKGVRTIANTADPIGSREIAERPGVRLFHLRYCRQGGDGARVGNPRHLLVYRRPMPNLVYVLRLLHDSMDISAQLDE